MNDNDKDNTFKEELEKELETGLAGTPDEDRTDDFTVRVRREDYIVKRRFYDKDKALETAESLRRDKRNLVEDNLEGQALSSSDDDDEKVDWDKLVDAGLVFDPPIAEAAEKKPGEEPVGLADHTPKPQADDKLLEKTLLVKRPRPVPTDDDLDEDAAFEDEDEGAVTDAADRPSEPVPPKRKKGLLIPVLLIGLVAAAVVAAVQFFSGTPTPLSPVTMPEPAREPVARPGAAPEPAAQAVVPVPPGANPPPIPAPRPEPAPVPVPVPAPAAAPEPPAMTQAVLPPPEPVKPPPAITDHFTHTVHVSSYRERDRANQAVALLRKKGHDAFTGVVRIPGKGDWFRVYVGYLKSLDEAKALADTIKSQTREDTVPRKMPWAVQVGDTALRGTLAPLLQTLRDKGYAVNTVPVEPGSDTVRILTGAFPSETEAMPMISLLEGDGFAVRAVER